MLRRWTLLFGFLKGLKLRFVRSKVTSKKFTILLFASMEIFRLVPLNTLQISCFVFLICLGVALKTARSSSWYQPTPSLSFGAISDGMSAPISSQVPARSYNPMVTSNWSFVFFFFSHVELLW